MLVSIEKMCCFVLCAELVSQKKSELFLNKWSESKHHWEKLRTEQGCSFLAGHLRSPGYTLQVAL